MHYSLLVIADGTKTLEEMMEPFREETAWENGGDPKWDWYVVGGRWRGLIRAKIGGHGDRSGWDFDMERGSESGFGSRDIGYWSPYEHGRFDVARVRDIERLNPYSIHDVLTPDGVWRSAELYVCGAGLDGRHFFENTWFHDGLLERLQDRYPDCLAFVVDFHS